MMPPRATPMSEAATGLCMLFILLVPLAATGLALINTGLGRSRSAAYAMFSSLCAMSVAALAFFVCGFAWQGFPGGAAHILTVGGKPWSWVGSGAFFLRHVTLDGSPPSLVALLGIVSVGLAALIPLGAGADRWKLGPICISTALLAGWTYPLFAHWVWGGWLAQLGTNYGLGQGFLDTGGASTVQVVGGLTALAITWILGPRRGKYTSEGMPSAIPGHNAVFVLFGCMLSLLGWWGLNAAGAVLYQGAEPGMAVLVAINTFFCAVAGALTAAVVTQARFGKPDASLTANGWVGGLAASSAACLFVRPAAAVAIGLAAGILVVFSVEWLELRLSVDDPGGAVSAHAVGGMWGLLSAGFLAHVPGTTDSQQWLAQLVGVATLVGFVLPLTYGLNWLLDRFRPHRVPREGEREGMDMHELGAGAYPELVTHGEEFSGR